MSFTTNMKITADMCNNLTCTDSSSPWSSLVPLAMRPAHVNIFAFLSGSVLSKIRSCKSFAYRILFKERFELFWIELSRNSTLSEPRKESCCVNICTAMVNHIISWVSIKTRSVCTLIVFIIAQEQLPHCLLLFVNVSVYKPLSAKFKFWVHIISIRSVSYR